MKKIKDTIDNTIVKQMYEQGLSGRKIAKKLSVSPHTIYKILNDQGVECRSNKVNSLQYNCDYDFFETIDTESKAYWLGFIYADGYVSNTKYSKKMGIALGIKDVEHLYKFKEFINSDHPIKIYKTSGGFKVGLEYCRIQISGDKIFSDLVKHGVIEHKSLCVKFPEDIPEELLRHFIRGYFEGNGCFRKNHEGNADIDFCSTFEFLTSLKSILNVEYRPFTQRYNNGKNNYNLTIMRREDVIRITRYMYSDASIYLNRKYEVAQTVLNGTYRKQEVS